MNAFLSRVVLVHFNPISLYRISRSIVLPVVVFLVGQSCIVIS